MKALRSLLFTLFQLLVTPVYAVVAVAFAWLPRVPRFRILQNWCVVNLRAAKLLCGIRYRVEGRERIPKSPAIILCKHSSTFETLAINDIFFPVSFVAKQELLRLPFFGWGFALASPITINRGSGPAALNKMVEQGRERVADGFWIAVFPEGTRIPVGKRVRYKTGGARLAVGMGLPVLPMAHNAGFLWPKGMWGKTPGTITVRIGKPIDPTGKDPAELMAGVEAWIEAQVEELGDPRQPRKAPRSHAA